MGSLNNLFLIFLEQKRNTAGYCSKTKQSNFNRHEQLLENFLYKIL
ncbi:hypothetical protein STRDD11_02121 [Streptococcus sp. DD11]|nr:hypothetical protein STRDD11_02121 [Streptococcus sp. DD11]